MTDIKPFSAAQEQFIFHLKKNKYSSSTILAYQADLKQLGDFLAQKQISQVNSVLPEHIEEFKNYLTEKKYTLKSVSRKLNSIKSFFRYLTGLKVIEHDPAEKVEHPKFQADAPRVLSRLEYRALRDAARDDSRMAAIIETLLQTGMRISELARMELDHISEKEIRIPSYESQAERVIPLNQAARRALDRYLEIRPPAKTKVVFITKKLRPMPVRNIRAAVDRYFRLAGIENATVNDLRHTFIVHQLQRGASPVLIQKIVGHKRLVTTEKYLKLLKESVAVGEKLEEL